MSEQLISLTLAYCFLTALLLIALIFSHFNTLLKTSLLITAIAFYVISYEGWKETQGWPSRTDLPEKFLLHSAVIEEPDEELGQEGQIYLWLTNLEGNELHDYPRAYRIEYDQETHSKVQEALREMQSGNLQLGEIVPAVERKESGKKRFMKGQKYPGLTFVKLPDPALPEK